MADRGKKPIPKSQREISISQQDPYVNPETGETAGNPNPSSTFNRGNEVSFKDDTVKPFSLGFKEIDEALFYYMENIIKPTVQQNGVVQKVPVIYGSPEKWKQVQKDGYYRDSKGKIMMPLITFKRNNIEKNRSITNKLDSNFPNNINVFTKSYSKNNAYSNFDLLNNRVPQKEYYTVVVPDYVTITYDFIISTYYIEQLNKLIEAFNYASDSYWGDPEKFKFRARIDSFATPVEIVQGGERTVKATFSLKLHGYIVPETTQKDLSVLKKFHNKTQTVFNVETSLGTSPLTPETYTPPPQNVDVYFNNILRYSPESGEDLFLILKNQDGDLITATFNGNELILPDETINIVDEDGNPLDSITFPVYTDPNIDITSYCPPPVGATLMKTGQTTSYRTGDDGDIEAGRDTDFYILSGNNPFGNTQRFTGITGGYYDQTLAGYYDKDGVATTEILAFPDDIVFDWSTYNSLNVLGYYRTLLGPSIWINAVDACLSASIGAFTSGWRLPNYNELLNIFDTSKGYGFYEPLKYVPSGERYFWSSTRGRTGTTYWSIRSSTCFVSAVSGNANYFYFPVRTFTVNGTTLT
jgi:hypothetical protein